MVRQLQGKISVINFVKVRELLSKQCVFICKYDVLKLRLGAVDGARMAKQGMKLQIKVK